MRDKIEVRALEEQDFIQWEELFRQYTVFYETDFQTIPVTTTWQRLLEPSTPLYGLAALINDEIVGIVHYVTHFSSWSIEPYFYIEDLFTSKQARKRGIGEKLIDAVVNEAKQAGAHRIYWVTKESNKTAQSLYDKKLKKRTLSSIASHYKWFMNIVYQR